MPPSEPLKADPVVRSDLLDRDILAIPRERVFTKRAVVTGFLILLLVIALGFGWMWWSLRTLSADTNDAVTRQIPALEEQIADQKIVIDQAVQAITDMIAQMEEAGLNPPEVILDPNRDEPPNEENPG